MRWRNLPAIAAFALWQACACPAARADGPPPPPQIPYMGVADLNRDLALDGLDFSIFCQSWEDFRTTGTVNDAADFDDSGAIDQADVLRFVEEWLKVKAAGAQPASAHGR